MDLIPFELSRMAAIVIFVMACMAGFSYRRVWKEEGPRWQLWVFGTLAGLGILVVAFTPLAS